jgi:hypothetical protein
MDEVCTGMQVGLLRGAVWRKSRRSNPSGNCVEIACLRTGQIAVRNSRHPDGPVLICGQEDIAAFVRAAKRGDLDGFLGRQRSGDADSNAVSTKINVTPA